MGLLTLEVPPEPCAVVLWEGGGSSGRRERLCREEKRS